MRTSFKKLGEEFNRMRESHSIDQEIVDDIGRVRESVGSGTDEAMANAYVAGAAYPPLVDVMLATVVSIRAVIEDMERFKILADDIQEFALLTQERAARIVAGRNDRGLR